MTGTSGTSGTRSTHRRALSAALLALPFVMAPGRCGFLLDYTETLLFPEAIEHIALGVDDGTVIATAYNRKAVVLKRHINGFEPSVEAVTNEVEDGALALEARCKYEGNCTFDHMFELPRGVSMEISMSDAQISLGYIDADIDATFSTGWFRGVRLEAPNLRVEVTQGDVSLDYAVAPASVVVEVDEGSVELILPPGDHSYDCNFDAGGEVDSAAITCDPAAEAVLDITVGTGDITVKVEEE